MRRSGVDVELNNHADRGRRLLVAHAQVVQRAVLDHLLRLPALRLVRLPPADRRVVLGRRERRGSVAQRRPPPPPPRLPRGAAPRQRVPPALITKTVAVEMTDQPPPRRPDPPDVRASAGCAHLAPVAKRPAVGRGERGRAPERPQAVRHRPMQVRAVSSPAPGALLPARLSDDAVPVRLDRPRRHGADPGGDDGAVGVALDLDRLARPCRTRRRAPAPVGRRTRRAAARPRPAPRARGLITCRIPPRSTTSDTPHRLAKRPRGASAGTARQDRRRPPSRNRNQNLRRTGTRGRRPRPRPRAPGR